MSGRANVRTIARTELRRRWRALADDTTQVIAIAFVVLASSVNGLPFCARQLCTTYTPLSTPIPRISGSTIRFAALKSCLSSARMPTVMPPAAIGGTRHIAASRRFLKSRIAAIATTMPRYPSTRYIGLIGTPRVERVIAVKPITTSGGTSTSSLLSPSRKSSSSTRLITTSA